MRSIHKQLLNVTIAIGALILMTATPTLASTGSALTFQSAKSRPGYSVPLSVRLLIDLGAILGVVVDDGVPF